MSTVGEETPPALVFVGGFGEILKHVPILPLNMDVLSRRTALVDYQLAREVDGDVGIGVMLGARLDTEHKIANIVGEPVDVTCRMWQSPATPAFGYQIRNDWVTALLNGTLTEDECVAKIRATVQDLSN